MTRTGLGAHTLKNQVSVSRDVHFRNPSLLNTPLRMNNLLEEFTSKLDGPTATQILKGTTVKFVKATVLSSSRKGTTLYWFRVSNGSRSWMFQQPFHVFHDFQRSLLEILDNGHMCEACCPWLWGFVSNKFPRRHLFRSNRPGVVAKRLSQLQIFLDNVIQASVNPGSHPCTIAHSLVPIAVVGFLFQTLEMKQVVEERQRSFRQSSRSISRDSTDTVLSYESACSICEDSPTAAHSFTTLSCGHVFHDDCVIEKLNLRLSCPTCGTQLAS